MYIVSWFELGEVQGPNFAHLLIKQANKNFVDLRTKYQIITGRTPKILLASTLGCLKEDFNNA
jgi:hypothetical protein